MYNGGGKDEFEEDEDEDEDVDDNRNDFFSSAPHVFSNNSSARRLLVFLTSGMSVFVTNE